MQFQVRASDRNGEVLSLAVEAATADAAVRLAGVDPADVLSVRPLAALRWWPRRRASGFPIVFFSQELLALLGAGLGLVEALEGLAEKEQRPDVRDTLQRLLARLREGQPLSLAMEGAGGVFPPLYVATVRASEQTGVLADALGRYVAYQAQVDTVRKKIVNACIYPALLLGVGWLVILFLMVYVVPRFATVFEGAHKELPLASRLLLDWGMLLHGRGTLVLVVALGLAALAVYAFSRPLVRAAALRTLWRIPALGERMHVYQMARFYRTLGMLLRGGVPLATGMEMVGGILDAAQQERLQAALRLVREGRSVSHALEASRLATPIALRMLRVSERAGNMGEMMDRIAAFHDEDMARWVEWATRLFEPVLMAVMGFVIGAIVILMYMPVFELAGSVG